MRAQKFDKKPALSTASSFISGNGSGRRKEVAPLPKAPRDESVSRSPLEPVTQQNKSALQLIKRCFALSRKETPMIIIGLCASVLSGAMSIGEAFIFGNLVELLNSTSDVSRLISIFCLLFFGLAVVALLARVFAGSAFGFVSENLVLRVRDVSFRTVLVRKTQSLHGCSLLQLRRHTAVPNYPRALLILYSSIRSRISPGFPGLVTPTMP